MSNVKPTLLVRAFSDACAPQLWFFVSQNSYRLQLLAPANRTTPLPVQTVVDPRAYTAHLHSLQQLRGRIYVEDGAIQPWEVDAEGRHISDLDESSWHFLLVNERDNCIGCARYLLHRREATFADLRLRTSALAQCPKWGQKLRQAVETELIRARLEGIGFAELGGWAIATEYRHTKAALEILLGSYLWAELIGHCLCATTATVRNQSAPMLRRMGGRAFACRAEELPGYFDPQYGCLMELLRFDSRELPARFSPLLREMRTKVTAASVLCAEPVPPALREAEFPLLHLPQSSEWRREQLVS